MKFLSLPALLAAVLFSAVVSLPFMPLAASRTALFRFEVEVTSTNRGTAQLFFDIGHGTVEEDSTKVLVDGGPKKQLLRFDMPAGVFRGLRFDPLDRSSTMTLRDAVIRDTLGTAVRRFSAADFKLHQQATLTTQPDGSLTIDIPPGANDPITLLNLNTPLLLRPDFTQLGPSIVRVTLPIFATVVAVLFGLSRVPPRVWEKGRVRLAGLAARPVRAVALVAGLAVVVSSYPVVFLGKSFVSPNFGVVLLYEAFPTLPHYRDTRVEEVKAADVGAIMWQHVPSAAVQNRAYLRDFELPLFNRYDSSGTQLLGQGQLMVGDPLHLFVILAHSAAWAWDLKYLLAKWLLAAGVGFCVWRATRHLPAALIVAAIMPFIGYFIYRVNHPAIFSMCYAPWILLCWIGIVQARDWRRAAVWVGGLMLANWCELTSGTAKEAYMSLLTLNLSGALFLVVAALPPWERVRRFAIAGAGGAIFALLAAPLWLTFLDALAESYTSYNAATAFQVQPSLALAFFDELLFRPYSEYEKVYNGSVNFVVLLGVLSFLVNLRRICTDRLALGLALAFPLPLALIFGVIPPLWIVKIPFLGNVAHVDNSFFVPVITLLGLAAGYGFRAAAERLGKPEGHGDLALAAIALAVLAAEYLAFGQTVQRSTFSYWHWGEHIVRSAFMVWGFLALLLAAAGFALTARWMLVRRAVGAGSLLVLLTCGLIMLWRFGLQVPTGFADYVTAPTSRVDFNATSPAVVAAREDQHGEPWRFIGLNGNAFHGWMNIYDMEGICGPEALSSKYYRELIDGLGLTRIWDWRIYSEYATLPAQKRANDFLNVRHYFNYVSDQALMGAILTPVKIADLDVYRSETAWPRAFFTDRIANYTDAKALGKLVNEGDGRPFAAMQTGDAKRPAGPAANLDGRTVTPAKNYHLTTNKTAFDIEASGPGMVVLQEVWLRRDFIARVDGKTVPYFRVNHAFKGLYLDTAGKHRIEFEYWPRRFNEALGMSGVGVIALLGGIWFVRRKPAGA